MRAHQVAWILCAFLVRASHIHNTFAVQRVANISFFVVGSGLSLYTHETFGEIVVRVNSSVDVTKSQLEAQYTLRASIQNNVIVNGCAIKTTSDASVCVFNLSSVPIGKYSSAAYIITSGSNIVQQGSVVISYWPATGAEVKVDFLGGGLIVDDRPFFSVGYFYDFQNLAVITDFMQREAFSGLNSPLPYRPPYVSDIPTCLKMLDAAQNIGKRIIFDLYGIGQSNNSNEKTKQIANLVEAIKSHPALLGYYFADEPDGQGIDPSWVSFSYNLIKQLDPYHPTLIALNCVNTSVNYVNFADVIMVDPYSIALKNPVGCDGCMGGVDDIRLRVEHLKAVTNSMKPIWTIPQAFGGVQHWYRNPSPSEMRAMTYLSLIGGASGITYFTSTFSVLTATWTSCRQLSSELNEIAPAIVSRHPAPTVETTNDQVKARSFLHTSADGSLVLTLLVANTKNIGAHFSVRVDVHVNGAAKVLFEMRNVSIVNSLFEDFVDAYGAHTYQINLDSAKNEFTKAPANNLIFNPSFEEQTLPGVPDGYYFNVQLGNSFVVDPFESFTGSHSLRVTITSSNLTLNPFNLALRKGLYEISFSAKSSSSAASVVLSVDPHTKLMLTPTWKVFKYTWNITSFDIYGFDLIFQQATFSWIDDVFLTPL